MQNTGNHWTAVKKRAEHFRDVIAPRRRSSKAPMLQRRPYRFEIHPLLDELGDSSGRLTQAFQRLPELDHLKFRESDSHLQSIADDGQDVSVEDSIGTMPSSEELDSLLHAWNDYSEYARQAMLEGDTAAWRSIMEALDILKAYAQEDLGGEHSESIKPSPPQPA